MLNEVVRVGKLIKPGDTIQIDRVEIGRSEVSVNVMWYEKIDVNSDVLEYHVARTDIHPIVQCSQYLLHGGFGMHWLVGAINHVPKLRLP